MEIGITEKELAKRVKCAQSTLHDILNSPEAKNSHLVPAIHKVFSWTAPSDPQPGKAKPSPSADAMEVAQIFDRLPEALRKAKIEELRATLASIVKAND